MFSEEPEGLKKKIKALIAFRVIFITLFFAITFFFWGFRKFPYHNQFLYLIIGVYAATIVYSILYGKIKNLRYFAYTQLVIDIIFETILIYFTGGIESWYSFTLIITILASSIVLDKKAGFVIATQSSIFYGSLLNLQFYGIIPVKTEYPVEVTEYLYKIFIHVSFFYITAYLSGYLSSRLETTEKKLEEKDFDIKDLEFFNQEIIESLPSGLCTTDIRGRTIIFNKAAERITGIDRKNIIGRKIDDVLPSFKFPFKEGRRDEVFDTGNQKKIIGLTISPFRGLAGDQKGFIVVFQDLTKIKQLEAEIQRKEQLATIGELSSSIAHEIRNPLASLKGSIQMLKEGTFPESHREKLMGIALTEMDRLNRIVTDFLIYSRPSPLNRDNVNICALLDTTIEILKNSASENKVLINRQYSNHIEIVADSGKLQQVFLNLGLNAVEAMPDGGELTVAVSDKNDTIEIDFKDTGTGIEEKNLKKIFYPFFTTKEQGTGLGLAIAYRIIEEHKGAINLETVHGSGTTFKIILPKKNEEKQG
ncbi:MAG: PAS domain S-box protein [Nitrospirae bacterium]|jgi:two-component system sensor histidine kinase PilS (NtrC family)|nr:PAS domain S-box protein [Nitrospirota bacterium]